MFLSVILSCVLMGADAPAPEVKSKPETVKDLEGRWAVTWTKRMPGRGKFAKPTTEERRSVWAFAADGTVKDGRSGVSGKWQVEQDGRTKRLTIYWDNKEKSWDEIPLPMITGGTLGKSLPGIKMTLKKVLEK